ncbi:unnamed protein product [Rhizopus stolonifer]
MAATMMKMITEHKDVSQILTCIYTLFLSGILLCITEIKTFDIVVNNFKFVSTLGGKCVLLLLIGSVVISNTRTFLLVTGILDLLFGLFYLILSFTSTCPMPKPVAENWQNWQEYSAEGMDLDRPNEGMDNATRLKLSMVEKPLRNHENV